MATLNVCCRLSSKTERFQISLQSLEEPVTALITEICNYIKSSSGLFDIIYAGQVLKPANIISSYHLQPYSTVYILDKFTAAPDHANGGGKEGSSKANRLEVTMVIQSALLNTDYRSIVERMLSDPDTVENIIATTPGLDKDPAVLSMLQEPELLAVLAHPNNLENLLQHHPSFAQAAITVATAVNEEGAKVTSRGAAGGGTYSMDQMSDDEDDTPLPNRARGNMSGITASQLAAAIQAATASGSAGTSQRVPPVAVLPSTSQGATGPSSSNSSGAITSDFFQQAMAHAQSASSDAALQQLREMGITDENVARQALIATSGDIQAAIDLIFGDELM